MAEIPSGTYQVDAGSVCRRHPRSGRNGLILIEESNETVLWKQEHGDSGTEAHFYDRVAPLVAIAPRPIWTNAEEGAIAIQYRTDLQPASQAAPGNHLSNLGALGTALARLHSVGIDYPPSAIPGSLPNLDPVPIAEWIDASDACRQVIRHVQQRATLSHAYAGLLTATGPHGFIHGDLKLDNILVGDEGPLVIDWEFSGLGPTSYDLATLLAALLGAWIRGLRPRHDQPPELWIANAETPLRTFRAGARGFLAAYFEGLSNTDLSPPPLRQVIRDTCACLVHRSWAGGLLSRELGSRDRLRLLVAESLVDRPDELLGGLRW